jgi:tRNA(adenine34) deaminase
LQRAPGAAFPKTSEIVRSEENSADRAMMMRCIELSREAARNGELPFAALICKDGKIIAESSNRVIRECDVSRHAEILALSFAQRIAGSKRLRGHSLYANVEPCPMCAFAIRETGISRLVYAIKSPIMGGHTRWTILGDHILSRRMPFYFSSPPVVVENVCSAEAEKVWSDHRPLMWKLIKGRGILG